MTVEKTYMAADYLHEGEIKRKIFEIDTADSQFAIRGLLDLKQSLGWDIQCIWEVIGVNSLDELEEVAKVNFVKPGLVVIVHVFDQEGE